jgi:hypothetical protein
MASLVVQENHTLELDPSDKRVVTFDWDNVNLATAVTITASAFRIIPIAPERRALSITRASTTATMTTAAPNGEGTLEAADHGLTTGDYVSVTGADQSAYNITAVITVTSASTFTYTVAGSPTTPATGRLQYLGPSLTSDNASIVSGSRKTQVRLDATTGRRGQEYELANAITTNESPAQTKEKSIRVKIQED